jgi:hypothetical protein
MLYFRGLCRALIVCLFVCIQASFLFAQFESGTVLGTVHDATGAVIPNATVTLESIDAGVTFQTKTDPEGNYTFINERLGKYRVHVEATGFGTATAEDFVLSTNARQRVDLTLQVGAAAQNVTVTNSATLLETDSSSRGQVINPQQIVQLPLNGRAYADLTLLVPGVAKSPLENQSDSSRDASFNVNGQRSELNNFLLDGIDNNAYGTSNQGFSNQVVPPSPDALAEFKVETNNYSAEFGRASGAVINATIKSGTNQLHGAAWEFLRNTDLNANGFFKTANGSKLPYNQNQFGGAAGGPIIKDKIFVFGDYEGFRRVSHPVQTATLPTLAMRNGDFSSSGVALKNPLTGTVYSNGIIPASAMSPLAVAALGALPNPTTGGTSNNYVSSPADTSDYDKGDIRYDQYIGQKVTVFARYSQNDGRIFSPAAIPGVSGGNGNGNVFIRNKQGVIGATWTISPTSVLEFRGGVDFTQAGKTPQSLGSSSVGFSVPNQPTDPTVAGGLYSVNLGGGFSALGRQSSNPQFQNPLVMDPKVNFSKILGRHSLKMGFEFQRINTAVNDFHPQYGTTTFTGYFSALGSTSGLSSNLQQVYSLADFLFGAPSAYELSNNPVANLRQRMYFGYLQDDFKVNERLTLNLGVRYEFATPQWERDNNLANFDPTTGTLIYAKSGSIYDRALVHPDTNNFAPRVGLAFQVTPKTVIRSGYGISYVEFNRLGGENLLSYNGPFVVDAAVSQVPGMGICSSVSAAANTCFRTTDQGFPPGFASASAFSTATAQLRYIPANLATGYVQSWHFTVQQELSKNWLLDVAYVGNHSVGLMTLADANQAVPNQLGQNLSVNARRPYQAFTTIEEAYAGGFGSYNALQVKLEKRFTNGFYFLNSFTWSKAIDNAAGHLENYAGDSSRIDIDQSAANKGLSSYDVPFNNTTSIVYDLPFGHGRRFDLTNKAVNFLAGGWSANAINTLTSGEVMNITYSPTTQGTTSSLLNYRPNLTGASIYSSGGNPVQFLNPAAFSTPSYTSPEGNAGRNIARGPYFFELDLGVHKNFNLFSESRYLQFRAEVFNLTNKTNFAVASGITTAISSGGFGAFTSTLPARQFQFALKLVF